MTRKKEAILLWMPAYLGFHSMAWRQERACRTNEMDFDILRRQIQIAERGKFHGAFFADTVAVGVHSADVSMDALSRTAKASAWEPVTLLSALAACTSRIGLLGTVTTSYAEPYNVARMFASLDHISGGRAGWNVVTTSHPKSATNFGLEAHYSHADRYERCEEFFNVVAGLWDSWEDDAFIRDKASGRYFDPAKLHALNHRGRYQAVAGPLNIARPPQGHPVIAQAGSSVPGRAFAARHADLIYTMQAEIKHAKQFYDDVKGQAAENGRDPDHVKILPAIGLMVGRSRAHAEEKMASLDELVDPVFGLEVLASYVRADLSGYPLDGPVPEIPVDESGSVTSQKYWLDLAKRDNLTIRQLMQVVTRLGTAPGSPVDIADMIEEWMEAGACDGFNITLASDEDSLELFVDEVIPELQRRGLFQTEYRGRTLRENLGLPRPENRFATGRSSPSPLSEMAPAQ